MTDKKDNVNSTDSGNNSVFAFTDYLRVVIGYKKILIVSTLIVGTIVSILMFFVIKPIYLSNATVKSAGSGLGLGGILGLSAIPDLGGLEELSGSGSKELALYEDILNSRRCIEETIIKFDLMEVYDIKYMQDAIIVFRKEIITISSNKKAGTLTIGVFDTDKQRAKDIADFLIFQLNKIFSEMSSLNAKNNKEFIEQRFYSAKEDLKVAEDSLKNYQDIFGLAPDIVAKAVVQSEIALEAEIKSEEIKLDLLRKILSPDQAEIKSQEEKIAALTRQLFEINNSTERKNNLTLKGAPDIVMNYIRLQRDLEIKNKIIAFIVPLYEQTKFEEKRETPTVIILDVPNLPEKKAKPKRVTTILISMAVFFIFLSIVLIYYKLYYKKLITIFRNAQ